MNHYEPELIKGISNPFGQFVKVQTCGDGFMVCFDSKLQYLVKTYKTKRAAFGRYDKLAYRIGYAPEGKANHV